MIIAPKEDMRTRVKRWFCVILNKAYPDWAIIQAKQNVSVEHDRYIIVDLRNERNLGDEEYIDGENEKIIVQGLREATLNIQAIGEGSVEALSNLRQFIERPTIVDEFFASNIAVNDIGEVQDLTDLLDNSRYLERANVDLTISYDRYTVDSPAFFDKVLVHVVVGKHEDTEMVTLGKYQ